MKPNDGIKTMKHGAAPYNNRFNPTQRGRHALCSTGSKEVGLTAKVVPEPPFVRPFQAGRKGATASRVNRALYGRNIVKVRH